MEASNVRVYQLDRVNLALDITQKDGRITHLVIPHSTANAIAEAITELAAPTEPDPVRVFTYLSRKDLQNDMET